MVMMSGCTTQQNTPFSRFYHGLTSHYNIYFNANESVKEGLKRMDKSVVEDYTHLLPVFPETNPVAAQAAASYMEYAVQKCQKLIANHSITVSPRRRANDSEKYKAFASQSDYNKWIDDTYLLMGQASYYLRDFHMAQESFNYILHNFSNQPTRNPAFLWLSRCYMEIGENEKTIEIFKLLERDGSLPDKIKKDLLLVKANYYCLKGDYKEAISLLQQALKFNLNRKEQGRYNFILGQLFLRRGQNDEALKAFKRVVRSRPPYRMAFEAKTSLLELSKSDPAEIDNALTRMIKNGNNHPYLDRLYYAKGAVALKSGKKPEAIRDFRTSVSFSVDNNSQRALSGLTVARLYLEEGNYRQASCYYDSAMSVINPGYQDYEEIANKTNGLATLVRNLDLITKEDSLQRVSLLTEKERLAYINKLIDKVTETEKRKLKEQQDEQSSQNYYRGMQYRGTAAGSDNSNLWYFYNPVTAGMGKTEFQQIWGKRRLEDNWRRKNKLSFNPTDTDQAEATTDVQKKENLKGKESNPKTVDYYLRELPLSDSLMHLSNDRIKSALFAAGRIYYSVLNNEQKAVRMYEDLNKRYPGSIYELSTWIEFHKMKYQADTYRNKIIAKYPESSYAKFLLNPNFFKDMEFAKQLMERKYEEAEMLYQKGDYSSAGKLVAEIMALQPDSLLLPKVKFIELIANGKNSSQEGFSKMLDKYISDFPLSPTRTVALKIRELIQQNSLAELEKMIAKIDSAGNSKLKTDHSRMVNDPFDGKYSYDTELFHYFVISFPKEGKVDVNRLIFDIANFNIDYYTSFDFDIEEIHLNDQTNLVVVRSLPNKEEGLGYFGNILKQKKVFNTLKGVDYHYFIASSPNYRKIIADQDLLEYLRFFVQNYSKNSSPAK